MQQFKWTPVTDQEIANLEKLPTEGIKTLTVSEAEAGVGQESGKPNLKVTLKLTENGNTWRIYDWFTDSESAFMKRKMKKFFESAGRAELFEKGNIFPNELLDFKVIAEIKHQIDKTDSTKKRLVVGNYLSGVILSSEDKGVEGFPDDDIKF